MERFLIATLSRNGYRSFEPRLLQQIKNLKAESEPENIEIARVAIGRSTKRSARRHTVALNISTDTSLWFTFSSLPITHCARTVRPWFCFKNCILWAICYLSELTFRCYSSSGNVRWSHFDLPCCVNKQIGVQLIWMNCMWNHFTVRGTVRSGILAFGIIGP
jgi:hypothetical protein